MRILICTLAGYGYVYPALGVAQELRQRGHEVAFVTGSSFTNVLAKAGFERIPRGDQDGESFAVPIWGHTLEILRQVKHIEYACKRFVPDVMLATHLTLGPLIAGRCYGIPVAVLNAATYMWPTDEAGVAPTSPYEKLRAHVYDNAINSYCEAAEVFGLSLPSDIRTDYRQTPLLGDISFLRSIPELEAGIGQLPPPVRFVGSCLWHLPPAPDAELAAWLADSAASARPLLFVQHGRSQDTDMPDFWPGLVQVARDLPVRVVAAYRPLENEATRLPDNFFARPYIPHEVVLPHADAVLDLGTSSTMLGALNHGLPLLLFTMGSEQPHVAHRCTRAGVALCLSLYDIYNRAVTPENVTPERIRDGLNNLLHDASWRQNARRIQRAFQGIDGFRIIANGLEELAYQRHSGVPGTGQTAVIRHKPDAPYPAWPQRHYPERAPEPAA